MANNLKKSLRSFQLKESGNNNLKFNFKDLQSGLGVDVDVIFSNVFCFVRYETARSCHLSVFCMNQTDELATKRVLGVITLLITNYLIFLQV